jgi:hypothetical protein
MTAENGNLIQKRAAVNDVLNEMHFRTDPDRHVRRSVSGGASLNGSVPRYATY